MAPIAARKVIAASTLPLSHTRSALGDYLGGIPPPGCDKRGSLHPQPPSFLLSPHHQPFIFCLLSLTSFLPSFRSGDPLTSGEGGRGPPPRSCQHLNLPQCELRVGQTGYGEGGGRPRATPQN